MNKIKKNFKQNNIKYKNNFIFIFVLLAHLNILQFKYQITKKFKNINYNRLHFIS